MNVFIVENHRDTLTALRYYFEDLGHQVKTATTLAEAQEGLSAAAPDLLLCDIGLPDGNGWDLLGNLPPGRSLYAVAMSGFGMNADSARSRESGFRHHLLKPFRMAELERILAEAEEQSAGSGKTM
jgi:DNA-binding response OmpR family regulator